MKKCKCMFCKFENPKPCVTGIIIKDGKLLLLKRNEEPHKGQWDLMGGYMNKNEIPLVALKREIKEELGIDCDATFIKCFTGTASYKDYEFPVLNFAFLVELKGEIKLNKEENSAYQWVPINKIKTIAFDSNKKILKYVKEYFDYDLEKIKELIYQLDSSAVFNEQNLYKATLEGTFTTIKENGELIGMGWAFPRQTLLRKQSVVEDIIVDENKRGKGHGESIMNALIKMANKGKVEVMELTTNPKRVAANKLYQKIGFTIHPTNHYLKKLK